MPNYEEVIYRVGSLRAWPAAQRPRTRNVPFGSARISLSTSSTHKL